MNAVRNNRAANNVAPNYDNLANNLTLSQFSSWARTGSGAIKDRRLVLNERRILNGNAAPRQVGPAQRRIPQLPGGGAMLTSRTTDRSDDNSKAQNKTARQVFLRVIQRECGARNMEELPYDVRVAMKLEKKGSLPHQRKDWVESRAISLSARRVAAVSTAVENYKTTVNNKLVALQMTPAGTDWLNADPVHRTFWGGLSQKVKNKLLSLPIPPGEGGAARHPLRLIWEDYRRIEGDGAAQVQAHFLEAINKHFAKGEVIPYWSITVNERHPAPNDPVASAIKTQMEKTKVHYNNSAEARRMHPLKAVLQAFDSEKSTLTFEYDQIEVQSGAGGRQVQRRVSHKLTLQGSSDQHGNHITVKQDDGPFRNLVEEDDDPATQNQKFDRLQDELCRITGLNSKELCILLSKSSTSGFTSETTDLKNNYLLAQLRKDGLCSSSATLAIGGRTKIQTTITVKPAGRGFKIKSDTFAKSNGFLHQNKRRTDLGLPAFNFEGQQGNNEAGDLVQRPDDVIQFPDYHKLHFECDYDMTGPRKNNSAKSHRISNLNYNLDFRMTQLNQLPDAVAELG